MNESNILVDITDRVATVTINRPDKLNALSDDVIGELGRAVEDLVTNDDVAGIIITGAGPKAFVAGADIEQLSTQTALAARHRALTGQRVFRRLETCGKPVIAAVNGFALGGGCELAMACHIRIASDNAKFGQPEVKLGICPGFGGTQRLPRLVGKGRALDLIMTGRIIDATEAERIGLVSQVVSASDLARVAREVMMSILAMGPLAIRLSIDAVDRGLDMTLEDGMRLEANHFGLLASSDDMREGMAAFLEKRPPNFTGR